MTLSASDYLLWVTGPLLLVLTCGAALKRRLVPEFPVFFAYAAFHVLRSAVLFAIYHRMRGEYFYAYWVAQVVSIVLGFAVIYELYCKVFQNYDAIQQIGGLAFACAAILLLAAAVWTVASAPGIDAPGIVKAVVLLERSVRVMQCGLLLFLFLLAFYFGLSWQNYLFGIAMGFGVFASIELAAIAVRSQVGVAAGRTLSQVNAVAYGCGVMIWLCYLLAPMPAPQNRGIMPRNDLEKWNQALLQILQR
jgi:hypothetical protein